MREYIVEVPTIIQVSVFADDASAAAAVAGKIVDRLTFAESLERVGGSWQFVNPALIPLDSQDAEPDVYVCSGGELTYISDSGPQPTGEDCFP